MKDVKDIGSQLSSVVQMIARRHTIIVLLITLGLMIYTVFSVNSAMSQPPDETYRAEQVSQKAKTTFDKDTISKLEQLKVREDAISTNLPSGRINPFVE